MAAAWALVRRLVPLTGTGVVVGLACAAFWVTGWQLGWIEAVTIAAGCLLALLLAVPFVVGRLRLDVVRDLEPERVMEGEAALAVLTVTNPTGRPLSPRTVEDLVDGQRLEVEVGALRPDESTEAVYHLPTEVRGRHLIGPAMVVRADPLGLMRREVIQTRQDVLWVHPRHRVVAALPVGFAKDLEGPTSDASPAGDVAFHALREYQVGDDYRHIHWLSTARTGTVMVRHYVDNRRPHLGVVLHDDRDDWVDQDHYEVGVRIATSLAVSSMVHGQPISVLHGGDTVLGASRPGTTDDALDRMSLLHPGEDRDLLEAVGHLRRTEGQVSATALVVGPGLGQDAVLAAVAAVRRLGRCLLVRVGAAEPMPVPGARVLEVDDLVEFVAAWNRATR